ncbi:MAG TPA: peptide deformylase [Bdellovibrionota bacterium]|jgi:peptide deformylase|nr:peptide deformylase [Bdellovibrionota bacterium]
MAKLKIYTFPDAVLAQKASPIDRVEKPLHRLADDMLETMYDAPGIGLAANQVGILQRMLVLDTEYEVDESDLDETESSSGLIRNRKPIIIINPMIELAEGKFTMEEGCLSVPEYTAEVQRHEKIKIRYQDVDGLEKTLMAEGLQAVCIQHEIDHLEGRLFIERLGPMKKEMAKKKLIRERAAREAEGLLPKKPKKGL